MYLFFLYLHLFFLSIFYIIWARIWHKGPSGMKLIINVFYISKTSGCPSAWYADGRGFDPHVRQNILSSRFGHEIISTTILSLPLIQEGQLSVTDERMGTEFW